MAGLSNKAGVLGADAGAQPDPARSDRMTRELTNLLDVSLRNVGTALRRVGEEGDAAADEATLRQLRDADWSLRRMAGLLTRWQHLGGPASQAELAGPTTTLALVIDEAVDCVKPLAERQSVTFEVELSPEARDAAAGRLQPVLLSGLEYAVRQAGTTGRVTIRAALVGEELELSIRPEPANGAEPSEMDESVAVEPPPGVLATALCRDIVRAMNGVLRYEDGGEGRGKRSEMLIRIPMGSG